MLPLLAAGVAVDELFNDGKVGAAAGEPFKDFSNVGKNRFQGQAYQTETPQWGGEGGADRMTGIGLQGMGGSKRNADFGYNQAYFDRGPQAIENQTLSDREAESRYGDQAGAIQLARERAMGLGPSEAAYAMQSGVNQANAQQQSMAGGARGAAGLAMAGNNAAATVANTNQNAWNAAGQLRAQEMNAAGQLYGGLSQGQREQDLQRLGQGNSMAQFNAQNNDNYRLGMLNASNSAGQTGAQWYGQSQNPYNQQQAANLGAAEINAGSYNQNQALNAGVSQANADERGRMRDRWMSLAGTGLGMAGSAAGSQGGGGPKPT